MSIETYLDSLQEDIEEINVSKKSLTYLPNLSRFKKLKILHCTHNQLTSLPPLEQLKELYCHNNQLTSLPPLEKLQILYCESNQLTSLPPLENLELLVYNNNPICEIINSDDIQIINQRLKTLNGFRYLYYCLKFKKRFRDWLWIKIREPKIREKYSHDYLVANLHEDTDLDVLLENW